VTAVRGYSITIVPCRWTFVCEKLMSLSPSTSFLFLALVRGPRAG